jgi:hypothetical protein
LIKVTEQEVKHDSMSANPPNKCNWIIARIVEEKLEGMNHDHDELDHL